MNKKKIILGSIVFLIIALIIGLISYSFFIKKDKDSTLTLADKIYDKLNGALGGELLNNPKTADFLTKAIFKYGRFMNDKRLNKKLNNLA